MENSFEEKKQEKEASKGMIVEEIEKKYGKPIEEVVKERKNALGLIAKMVGSDFDMKVDFGEVGEGSFFIPDDKETEKELRNTIKLDPLILLEEGKDEFVAAHEGSHRAITRTMNQVGLKLKKEKNRYTEKIGFQYIHNALEDPAVNNWVGKIYPKIEEILENNYDKQFEDESAVMSTPKINQVISTLGYVPDFVKYGSEMMRFWHTGKVSENSPEAVKEAMKVTNRAMKSFWSEIPYSYPTEKEVLASGKNRWLIYEKGIWPFVEKMIENDNSDEKLKQYLKDQIENMGDGGQGGGGGGGESLEDLMDELGFTEEEKKEMREKMKQAEEKRKEREKELREKLAKGEMSQEEFNEEMGKNQKNMPIDAKSFSGSIKEKIKGKFKKESVEKQDEISEKAKKSLEEIEDMVNEDVIGKLGEKEETHEEYRERMAREDKELEEKAERILKELEKKKLEDEEFEKWSNEQERTEWEKVVSEQGKTIDALYSLIEELFQKNADLHWEKGFPNGQRLDLKMAMQFEANPSNYTKLWEKKSVPEKSDYRFLILNDQSGSMAGTKAKNDLIAKAIVVEVLTALNIPCEILGFSDKFEDTVKMYKSFKDDLNENRKEISQSISQILKECNGGTPTYEATKIASEELAQQDNNGSNAHFLITITDGIPTGDESLEDLRDLIKKLEEENGQIIIGMGMGEDIEQDNMKKVYGERYIYAEDPEELPKKIADLLKNIFIQSQRIE